MTDQLDAINAALAAARNAAAVQVPATVAANNNVAVATPAVAAGRPVSMREMLQESGMAIDKYLKLDKAGFAIGEDLKNFIDEIEVEFRFSDAKVFYSCRYGNPAKYSKSFDRIVDAKTKKPWSQVLSEAQAADPKCTGDYRALDLPFTVLTDVKNAKGDTVLFEAGKKLGWTSSVTNWKYWQEFATPFYALMDAGVISEDVTLRGKIVHKQETRNGNTWGLLTFVDFVVSSVEPAEQEAA